MHQIRVHFSALGHPVAGDPVYGRATRGTLLKRQFLHAALLRFDHRRTGEEADFRVSRLPEDLSRRSWCGSARRAGGPHRRPHWSVTAPTGGFPGSDRPGRSASGTRAPRRRSDHKTYWEPMLR